MSSAKAAVALVVCAALAGCKEVHFDDGKLPCSAAGTCPAGYVCRTPKRTCFALAGDAAGIAVSLPEAGVDAASDTDADAEASAPPRITTGSLPDSVVGQAYQVQLAAAGGQAPILWVLPDVPAELRWLRVEATTGVLSGTPTAVTVAEVSLPVQVIDHVGASDLRRLAIRVTSCVSGTEAACVVGEGAACLSGVQSCVDGAFQPCGAGVPSLNVAHCGPTCGACGVSADTCAAGRCRCGDADPCSGTKADCCGGSVSECVDTKTDPRFCGSCATACATNRAHATAACVGGACTYPCDPGWARCPDGASAIGCDTHIDADGANCGACGKACSASPPHATPAASACAKGKCAIVCDAKWDNCDGDPGNGCEVDLSTTTDCGACGVRCPGATGGGAACEGGKCKMTCPPGSNLCGTTCISNDDLDNCGGCAKKCTLPANATGFACIAGACVVKGCNGTYADCNKTFADGCEVNPAGEDVNNCGSCGHHCAVYEDCSAGNCYYISGGG